MKNKNDFDPRCFLGIAHRGFHDEVRPENSMAAFENAVAHDLMFECDVHLTKDGEVLVSHDSDLLRMSKKPGKIEELTLAQIRAEHKLPDGSDYPLLKDVLAMVDERVPIVVEIKVVDGNYKQIVAATLPLLSHIKNPKNITLISFDPRALKAAKKSPFTRGLLICEAKKWVLICRNRFDYLDIETSLVDDKRVVSYRKKGGLVNVWTVETPELLSSVSGKVDMITFQHLPIEDVRKAH